MPGAAISFATRFMEDDWKPDLILCSDMLDLSTFLGLNKEKSVGIKTAIYFHENQLSYPWSPTDQDVDKQRDNHYKFINYTSALAADDVFFNSEYHMNSFLDALGPFLKAFPDHQNTTTIKKIKEKSSVLSLGLDLQQLDGFKKDKATDLPVLLWNHRWEYDKNPEEAEVVLVEEILHFGYVESLEEYAALLWQADILPVTSNQDFFGGSIVEAMYCDCVPILPNRLTYPQHVGVDNEQYLYHTDKEFKLKLKQMILDPAIVKRSLRERAVNYDWTQLISNYDKKFRDCIS
jgi:glycosyltransferase involved in cell wall biosynthesis